MNKLFDKITTNQSKINIIWIDDISKDGEFLSLTLVDHTARIRMLICDAHAQ